MPWDDDDYEDDEWVEDEGADDPDAELLQCPSCGKAVHEDTQQCPHCGDWIIPVYADARWKRWVWAAAAILIILSMILFTVL
jgi:predicted nucleic acid-binding Zn ribbon protein